MDYRGKYIKIIHQDLKKGVFYKITYGVIKDEILLYNMEDNMLLVGTFYSKMIDENGKFIEGGSIDQTCYVAKKYDCNRIVEKDEYEYFKTNFLKEIEKYERENNSKK